MFASFHAPADGENNCNGVTHWYSSMRERKTPLVQHSQPMRCRARSRERGRQDIPVEAGEPWAKTIPAIT
jgi:hypothetical protein